MIPIKLTLQLYSLTIKRDQGKITFEFGTDSLPGIQALQALNAKGDMNFACALVPFSEKITEDEPTFKINVIEEVRDFVNHENDVFEDPC